MSYIAPNFFFYMIRLVFFFQDTFYCTNEVPKKYNQFWYFRHGVESHFLVLAKTLIYKLVKKVEQDLTHILAFLPGVGSR